MKFKKALADKIAKVSLAMAKKFCGAASAYGVYQPKEPEVLKKIRWKSITLRSYANTYIATSGTWVVYNRNL